MTATSAKTAPTRSIDEVLAAARARLQRVSPQQAWDLVHAHGGVLVDIRPQAQRDAEGSVPQALVVERNVLEWRFDPVGEARLPIAGYDLPVVVLCSQGYTSSLAADALREIGIHGATDVVGGYQAWAAAGLPVSTGRRGRRLLRGRVLRRRAARQSLVPRHQGETP